jgi:hypothetical protein
MTFASLDYPTGRPFAPALALSRGRRLPPDAQLLVHVNETVHAEQPIARSGADGVALPVLAGLSGRISDARPGSVTIEGAATLLHGVVGVGAGVAGPLVTLPHGESYAVVPIPAGAIIVVPQQAPLMLMQRAMAAGAAGIIAASASARELEGFVRMDLSLLLDGLAARAPRLPLTIVLTEGLGSASMRPWTYQMLTQRLNAVALIDGATDPRRSTRPEILLPLPSGTGTPGLSLSYHIERGAQVLVTAGVNAGKRGQVTHIFARLRHVDPGILTSCVMVRFEDGASATTPTFALDRVG